MSYFLERDILWTIWWHDTWLGSIELNNNSTRCNERNMTTHSLNWLKGVRWLTKVDRLRDKLKTQLFRYANANRCHVQRWTIDYFHINKWKPFPFPLISPPRKESASFCFYKSKEGIKHLLNLIKWRVHSHIFHEPEKGGVHSQIGSFIFLFY